LLRQLTEVRKEAFHQTFSFVLGIQRLKHVTGALVGEVGCGGKPPAIEYDVGAGDAGRLVAGEKQSRIGNLFSLATPVILPPMKWSDLRYVFDIKEDCKWRGNATSLKRLLRSYGRSMFWSRKASNGGRDPPDRRERSDLVGSENPVQINSRSARNQNIIAA
jgi:hypothetical protein